MSEKARSSDVASPSVFIVILTWNGWTETRDCLRSLERLEYPNHRIVVVDNGSTDGTERLIRRSYPDVTVLQTGANLGFSGGNNRGIKHALDQGATFVWLLNNDTLVDPAALGPMVKAALGERQVGIVGSVLRYASDRETVQAWGGGKVNLWIGSSTECRSRQRLDFITAASMLVRREVFEQIGLFDDTFFIYWEDADFCLRATAKGWKLCVAEDSRVYHRVSASLNRDAEGRSFLADRIQTRSAGIFIAKHCGLRAVGAVPVRLAGTTIRRVQRGEGERIVALARELISGLRTGRQRMGAPPVVRR